MSKKYKYFLFFCLIIVFFFATTSVSLSISKELEVELPGLGRERPLLPDYIKYIFNFAMMLAGAIALIVLIAGAIRYLTSAGNSEAMGDAKKRMFSAIFGLVLLFSSWLIMQTINPKITIIELPTLKGFPGVYFVDARPNENIKIKEPALNIADKSSLDSDLKFIYYDCCEIWSEDNTTCMQEREDKTPLLIYIYPKEDLEPDPPVNTNTMKLNCGRFLALSFLGKSFELKKQSPGVYLHYDVCSEISFRTPPIQESQSTLPDPFNYHVGCVEIINDPKNNVYFGVMLHTLKNQRGISPGNIIFSNKEERVTQQIDISSFKVSSTTVFTWQPDPKRGDYVVFYSRPFTEASRGGFYTITNQKIRENDKGYMEIKTDDIKFNYGPGVIEKEVCPNFTIRACAGSMHVSGSIVAGSKYTNGDYLVFVCGPDNIDMPYHFCQGYRTNVENFDMEYITRYFSAVSEWEIANNNSKVIIIPVQ